MKTAFVGGTLSFKGDKKKPKKKVKADKHRVSKKVDKVLDEHVAVEDGEDDDLTEAERRALRYKKERQRKEIEESAQKSHRERIEEMNEKLGTLTEHNDIPRVSEIAILTNVPRFGLFVLTSLLTVFILQVSAAGNG